MKTPRIRRLRRRNDVDGLVAALSFSKVIDLGEGRRADSGVDVRLAALAALAEIGGAEDMPRVAAALQDRDPLVRQTAVRVIRRLDLEGGADLLAETVVATDLLESDEVRREAVEALGELKEKGTEGVATRLAMAAAGRGATEFDDLTKSAVTGFVADAPEEEVSALVSQLIQRLRSGNGSVEPAQVLLSWLGPHSVGPLIEVLERDRDHREPAAGVLGAIRDSRALDPLVDVLQDGRTDVRRVAAWALGELRDPRTAEALMKATMDDEYAVRCQAAEALDGMGSIALMAGVASMIRSLEDRTDRSMVARLVEEGLERTPTSPRDAVGEPRWAPGFVQRFQLRNRAK